MFGHVGFLIIDNLIHKDHLHIVIFHLRYVADLITFIKH